MACKGLIIVAFFLVAPEALDEPEGAKGLPYTGPARTKNFWEDGLVEIAKFCCISEVSIRARVRGAKRVHAESCVLSAFGQDDFPRDGPGKALGPDGFHGGVISCHGIYSADFECQ